MKPMTIQQIIQATGARAAGAARKEDLARCINHIVRDSREVTEGSLFVAIAGENVDGHRFIETAWQQGAVAVLAKEHNALAEAAAIPPGRTVLWVPDPVLAMGQIAHAYRLSMGACCIAITGSVGKTSCKDMVAAALSGARRTIKTQANFNNHIGVPLTLFQIEEDTQAAVVEMGMNHFGEIDYLASLTEPEYGIITNIGLSHIENLGSQKGILQAKLEMVPHIKQAGTLFLNGDDPLLYGMKEALPVQTEYFGFEAHNQARVLSAELNEQAQLHVQIEYRGEVYDFVLRTMGRHMAYNALPAIMTAVHLGLTHEEIVQGLEQYVPTPHRLEIIRTQNYLLIDDTYNANPVSMQGALEAMDSIPSAQRRVAILGDMFELGDFARQGHEQIGRYVAQNSKVNVLIACGSAARWIYEAAKGREESLRCYYFEDVPTMEKNLFTILRKDDIILLKASHGMAFSAVCDQLAKHQ